MLIDKILGDTAARAAAMLENGVREGANLSQGKGSLLREKTWVC